ncbi:gastrotropin-like protein [Labeo rohita]|uniref:Gastrotropin-like protein n=2 Tax=Labeo rohita TaxID=84645 RepID=A0A498LG54_LABRO|nr:gastrotropin [Labeo rohita]KAI2651251.1 Gastrotropin [Labeo rohita]RXN07298.1 gastrotropin-like protein [Labeo rohita]RXN36339.1 gastrotropin-like protein [Labeo rohita]
MAFNGKWETESQEGYEPFLKIIGIPDDIIAKGRDFKLVTEVIQNGDDFTWIQYYPNNHVVTNKFVAGKESEMETVGGKKFKGTVNMEGGKLTIDFPKYNHTSEIRGGKLVETSTASAASGPVVFVRTSKKI